MIVIRRLHVVLTLIILFILAVITHFYKKEISELIFVFSNLIKSR